MGNLSTIGRIFYGIAMAALGLLTIYYKDFPYMMIPPVHTWLIDHMITVYISGMMLFLAGACIAMRIGTMLISLLLGVALLLIFCFYFIPYQFSARSTYNHLAAWENAFKELTLSAGAFVVAGCFPDPTESPLIRFLKKLIPLGPILFALTIICFGINHFVYAKEAAGYVPSWIPAHIFWIYLGGIGLLGSGIAILLKIRRSLFAALLGSMILIWVIILHIPYAMSAPFAENAGEVVSAFLALAYCGIAYVIAGVYKQRSS